MPGILPVDDPHPLPGIEEVLAQGIAMAGRELRRMRVERLPDPRRLRHRRVVPLGQRRLQLAEDLQVVLDHREELEAEREPRPAPVQPAGTPPPPAPPPPARGKRRRHRPPRHVPRQHQPPPRVDVRAPPATPPPPPPPARSPPRPRGRYRPPSPRRGCAAPAPRPRPAPGRPGWSAPRAAPPPRPPRTRGSSASPPAPRPPSPPRASPRRPDMTMLPATVNREPRPVPEADKLDAVYAATSAAEIARTYDAWAATYDAEMAALGYRHPTICLALLARHLPPGGPVLDAGAGTGLLGEWLKLTGYAPVEAVDLSPGMLAVAAAKGVYDRLEQGDLTAAPPLRGRPLRRLPSAPASSPPATSAPKASTSSSASSAPAASSSSPSRTRPGRTASPPASRPWKGRAGWPASTPPPPTARCPAAPTTPRAAASSSAASDRGKIVDAPTAHGEPSSPGGREAPTMIRRILATTALAGALARGRRVRAGLARPDPAHAERLDRPAHHHPHHGRGAGEGRPQRRVRPGRLPRPVRRPQDRRPARRHGDLGDHRPRGHGRGDRHRPGRQPRRDRDAGDRGMVVPRLHDRRPAPASPTGRRCSSPPAPRPSPPRRPCPTAATSAARSPGAASTRSASRPSSSPSR